MTHAKERQPVRAMIAPRRPAALSGLNGRALLGQWQRLIRLQIGATAATYGMIVSGLLLLRFVFGESLTVISLFNSLALWLVGGCCISLLAALLAPHRRYWMLWSLPGVVTFVVWGGLLFLPGRPWFPPETSGEFSVATFNAGSQTLDDDAYAVLLNLDVDILGVQELSSNQLDAARVEPVFPYHYTDGALGLFSRTPLTNVEVITYPQFHVQLQHTVAGTLALRAETVINGRGVTVIVAHPRRPEITVRPLVYNDSDFRSGFGVLQEAIPRQEHPVILLCDCNFAPESSSYGRIARLLNDSWRQAGYGLGFTAPANTHELPFPIFRGDYVWHSDALATLEADVLNQHGGSDHFPVRVRLGWVVED